MSRPESDRDIFVIEENQNEIEIQFPIEPRSNDQAGLPSSPKDREQILADFDSETAVEAELALSRDRDKWKLSGKALEYLANAKVLLAHEDYQLATRLLGAVLQENDHHPSAMKAMAEALYRMGDYVQAETCYRALVKIDANTFNLVRLGLLSIELNKHAAAEEYFQDAIAVAQNDSPELFEAYKQLGNVAVRAGDFEAAEENYNKAYTMDPDSDALLVNYGTLEIQRGNLEKAVLRFRQAVESNRNNSKAWIGLALIHREYGDHELAWANLERILADDPSDDTAIRLVCSWATAQNKIRRSIELLENYIDVAEPDVDILLALSSLLLVAQRYKQARLYVSQAIEMNPEANSAIELMQVIEEAENGARTEIPQGV